MTGMPRILTLGLCLICAITAQLRDTGTTVIRDIRVFDGNKVSERQTVVLRNGKIERVFSTNKEAVPAGATVIPGEGRTLLPGLVDSHVHVSTAFPEEALRQAAAFGVTAVVDMWSSPPPPRFTFGPIRFKELNSSGRADLAAVRTAGIGVTAPGGHGAQPVGPAAPQVPVLPDAASAQAFVDARIAEGSEFIKIIYETRNLSNGGTFPTLTKDEIAAVTKAAHARGRLAVAHIGTEAQARGAIAAGVDGLAHIFSGMTVSSDFGEFAKSKGVFVIPTLAILYASCGQPDSAAILSYEYAKGRLDEKFAYGLNTSAGPNPLSCDGATKAVGQLAKAGALILAGTDSPGIGTAYGVSLHWELEHLVEAGLTPIQALTSATSIPAGIFFKGEGRGEIKPGARADLLLVEGNPAKDIKDTRRIVEIWNGGVPVAQRQ